MENQRGEELPHQSDDDEYGVDSALGRGPPTAGGTPQQVPISAAAAAAAARAARFFDREEGEEADAGLEARDLRFVDYWNLDPVAVNRILERDGHQWQQPEPQQQLQPPDFFNFPEGMNPTPERRTPIGHNRMHAGEVQTPERRTPAGRDRSPRSSPFGGSLSELDYIIG